MNSGQVVELFDGGWPHLGEGLPRIGVIEAGIHPFRQGSQQWWVNVEVAWVYELFMTTLDIDRFLVEDILALSHGRGVEDRGAGGSATSEKFPIAGALIPSAGKNCGKLLANGCVTCASPYWGLNTCHRPLQGADADQ